METETEHTALDRWQVMKAMRAEGKEFAEMVPLLGEMGLLACRTDHRSRVTGKGATVCSTCEDTISAQWRRGLTRLAETGGADDLLEAKGSWIEAYTFIRDTCRKHAVVTRVRSVTRTKHDGTTETTETREAVVNGRLLRLLAQVSDKLARVAGVDVEKTVTPSVPVELHFHEREANDGDDTGAPN